MFEGSQFVPGGYQLVIANCFNIMVSWAFMYFSSLAIWPFLTWGMVKWRVGKALQRQGTTVVSA